LAQGPPPWQALAQQTPHEAVFGAGAGVSMHIPLAQTSPLKQGAPSGRLFGATHLGIPPDPLPISQIKPLSQWQEV
jgi:hypothetical protein